MISRRALVAGGVLVVGAAAAAHLADVDDDLLRAAGARPRALPDPGDERRLAAASSAQAALLAEMEQAGAAHPALAADLEPLLETARAQARGLGATGAEAPPATVLGQSEAVSALAAGFTSASREREEEALTARSPELARVLASLAAGQAQLARRLEQLA